MIRSTSILLLLILPLSLGGCSKKSSPAAVRIPAAPPAPDYFMEGEGYFEGGKFKEAAAAYERYLSAGTGAHQDKAMLRLALAHYLPGSPMEDPQKARSLLRRMVEGFPDSPFRPHADFILGLEDEIDKLRNEASDGSARIARLTKDMEKMRGDILRERQAEVDKLRADVREKDERIKRMSGELEKLATELEKLKKIDMERRPSRPRAPE